MTTVLEGPRQGAEPLLTVDTLTRNERSLIAYVETCVVDNGGLLEGQRMNADDHNDAKRLEGCGVLMMGRVPMAFIQAASGGLRTRTHWATLTPLGWELAHGVRQLRAKQRGPHASAVFAELTAAKHLGAVGQEAIA